VRLLVVEDDIGFSALLRRGLYREAIPAKTTTIPSATGPVGRVIVVLRRVEASARHR
jgi:hypothetical protein